MKKYLIALMLCLLFVAPAARAAGDDALKTTIENRYQDLRIAAGNDNPEIYKEYLTPDFTSTNLAGKVLNADQIVEALAQRQPDESRTEKITINSLKKDGDDLVVGQSYDMTALRLTQDGSKIRYHMTTESTDTWVKVKDDWLLQKSETDKGDVYIDDQLVAHRVRSADEKNPVSTTPKAPAQAK